MTVVTGLRRAFLGVVDLAMPARCGGCGSAGSAWCPTCDRLFSGAGRPPAPQVLTEGACPVWSWAPYGGRVREALVAYKDGDRRDLVRVLAPALAEAMSAAAEGCGLGARGAPVDVVPVPSSPAAARRRGDEPLTALARAAARRCDLEVRVVPALRVARRVADQAGLGALDLAANVEGAFVGRGRVVGLGRCLVVDDLVTTGATLAEAARALRAAGARPVGAAVVAATERRVG